MDFKENVTGGSTGEFRETGTGLGTQNVMVKEAPEYEDVEGEKALGIYSGDTLLGVCWNEDIANAFKEAVKNVNIKLSK